MRYFLLLLTSSVLFKANCQIASYNLVLYDSCSNSFEYAILYTLEENETVHRISDTLGTIKLKSIGAFRVRDDFNSINQEITIEPGINIDTLSKAKIQECLQPVSHPNFIGYCCCSEKCEGFQQDFYNNGVVRIEGTFKAGIPTGEVKYYYDDGTLKMVKFYNRKGILKRTEEYAKID